MCIISTEVNMIFKQEQRDGLESIIKANTSIAYEMVAREVVEPRKVLDLEKVLAYQKRANSNQKDLYYLDTVLVSTNWNRNDDVFLPERVWNARATAEDKQFNFMHNENDIIGHITGCYVVDKNNQIVDDKVVASDGIPSEFDIITESVIYKAWSDPKNQERIDKILAEIKQGLWYVSMECLFNGFDYAIIEPNGNSVLLERSEASAYLSKHLRAYGGTGEYEGYKIGRALKEIAFSGKGLVSKPANPRSIIIRTEASFSPKQEITKSFVIGEKNMEKVDEVLAKQLEETKAQLNKALAEIEQTKANESKKLEEAVKTLASEKADVTAKAEKTVADAKAEFEAKSKANQVELDAAKADLATKTAELVAIKAELAKAAEDKKMSDRKDKLVKCGFSAEEAESSVADYNELSDASFDKIISKFVPFGKKDDKKEEDKKDAKAADDKKEDKKKEDKSEASDATFDGVKSKASLADVETDTVSQNRKALAGWYESMIGVKQETSGESK